jgi:hypothetical protein
MTFTTGDYSGPVSVVIADFNNDTHLDIAVSNYGTHNIGIFLGDGNGTFGNQTTFSTNVSRPLSIAVGDINNDHWLDIVVTNNGTHSISIFFGHGNGSFGNQVTYSTGYDSFPYSVVVAHLNNDHYLDIAVANYGTDNIGVFLGYRNGSFTTQIIHSTSPRSRPYSIAVDDFNSDGNLDIVVANSGSNNVGILLGFGNGSFLSQKTYSVSPESRPQSVVIGDFDQDDKLDIAVSNYDTNNISILIGYGNGSFATPTMHSTGIDSAPFGMAAGDFNNDNQSDIAVTNVGTNKVFVLIGYTMMQSENPTEYSTGIASNPYCIASGDFNNDTQLDLVVANYGTNNAGIFLGYGNGSFQEQTTYSTGNNSRPIMLTTSDLDNDYRLDIVVANSNTQCVGILYGYGNGAFATVVSHFTGDSSYPISVIADDFNNDNHLDIAFADYNTDNIGIFLGYGNRTFGKLTTYSTGDNARSFFLASGGFNNDSRSDIAVANYGTNNIVIFLGSGDGTFILSAIYATGDGSGPWMLTIADLNKDNHLDIIVVNSGTNNIGVFFGFGNGSFNIQQTYSTGSSSYPSWVSVADFNNDSWLDLAVANAGINDVGIFLGNSYGYFSNQSTYSTGYGSNPQAIAVGDFNEDNRLDIAAANYGTNNIAILLGHPNKYSGNQTANVTDTDLQLSSTISINYNHGNRSTSTIANQIINSVPVLLGNYYATFRSKISYSTGSSSRPYSIAAGDLNNDTRMDLVVANSGNENIGIFYGYGNGSFATEMIYPIGIGSTPESVIVGDFNRDNQLDVAVTDPTDDSVVVLLGNGNGTFPTEYTYSTGSGSDPGILACGDLNNDNYLDLVVANGGTDSVGIFFGYGYTVFATQTPCESGDISSPYWVAASDFNKDGHLDIVSALFGTDSVGVFLGYGNGTFTQMMTYADVLSSHPWSVAVGDFNNDKQLDITTANWGTNSISVVLGYGNGSFGKPILYSTGPDTRPLSVAVGDFNNDSCLDITTANYGGNSVGVFLGYGNGSFGDVIILSSGVGSGPHSVSVSDINNDTHSDIIVANYLANNVGVFLGYGNGHFRDQVLSSSGTDSSSSYVQAGDFNKDGQLDAAVANAGTSNVGVLYGYGNGSFGNLQTYATGIGSNPLRVDLGDFNNDDQLDIVVAVGTNDYVGIFFGYSDGTFASMSTVPTGQNSFSYSVAVGDFNNDNRLDFTIADNGNNNIGVFLSYGSKPFGGQTTFFMGEGSRPSSVVIDHFNNDSQLDIAIANSGTNNIGILLGYGNRTFTNVATYSTGTDSSPVSLDIGDFNDDSLTDIAVANSNTNNVVVLIGYGNGSFFTFMPYPMGDSSQPASIAVGDFNRDHQLDIAVANYGTNNVCILFGCGNGTFTILTRYPLGYDSRPTSIIFKDLNNDGWEDIAVATSGIDNIKILLNLC